MSKKNAGHSFSIKMSKDVTENPGMSQFIQWANCVRVGVESLSNYSSVGLVEADIQVNRKRGVTVQDASALTSPIGSSGEAQAGLKRESLIEHALRLRDCPLWKDSGLPPFNTEGRTWPTNAPLLQAARLHSLAQTSKEYREIVEGCRERFNQHIAIQRIRRTLLLVIGNREGGHFFDPSLCHEVPFVVTPVVDRKGEVTLIPHIPEIYRLFLGALYSEKSKRIKKCVGCGDLIWAKPSNRETCSNRCRMRKSRRLKGAEKRDRTADESKRGEREHPEDQRKKELKLLRERQEVARMPKPPALQKRAPRMVGRAAAKSFRKQKQ